MNKFIPLRKPPITTNKSCPEWLTLELKVQIRLKKRIWYLFLASKRSNTIKIEYTIHCNKLKKAIKGAKISLEIELIKKSKSNPKLLYSYANNQKNWQDSFEPDFPSRSNESCPFDRDLFNISSVKAELDLQNILKPAGGDGIYPSLLRNCSNSFSKILSLIYIKSSEEGCVPEKWKEANLTPVFKKGSRTNPSNYRPIAITSVVCKIMEKLIKNTITNHLIKHNLLSVHQHGFVRNKSCLTNLLETLDLMTEAINSGSTVDAVFLDLAKAFDIVPHEALIIKLKAYGINGTLLQWCISFVTGRKQRVIMGKYISEWKPVLSGIFQGSCLGPTFFIIFNNDMPDKMKHFIKLFADDTKLIAIINNLQDNLSFQLDINAASKWTSDWHMRFNEDKCKIMHIMKKRKQDQYKHSYTLNDKDLVETVSERDLGVIISNDLNQMVNPMRNSSF